jgi:nicotinate-nucleotide adenylyltransferase
LIFQRVQDTFGHRDVAQSPEIEPQRVMRIGIFGGSFDPIHIGHLWIAETAIESLQLDQLLWIPAANSPLKPNGPTASDQQRLQMVRLAVSGCEGHVVDDREINRGDISYTVDTLEQLSGEYLEAQLFLVIGSDSLASFPRWYRPERLLELATPAVVQRGGEEQIDLSVLKGLASEQTIAEIDRHIIQMPIIELSSSELRQRVATGRSIRFRVPRAVEALIEANHLYA